MFKLETKRLIKKTYKRFLSLVLIVLIGVAFMMGLFSTATIMRKSVDAYVDEESLLDVQLYSDYGFCKEDVEFLKEYEGIEEVFPSKFKDVYCEIEDEVFVSRFEELDRNINKLKLVEGRMPEMANEVLMLNTDAFFENIKIGDEFKVYLNDDDVKDYITYDSFKVVGKCQNPAYMAKTLGVSTLDNKNLSLIFFTKNGNLKADYYSTVCLTLKGANEKTAYSNSYKKYIEENIEIVENAASEQESYHRDKVVKEYQDELDEKIEEFNTKKAEGEEELKKAKQELDDANIKIISGEAEINTLKMMLNNMKGTLESYEGMLHESYPDFNIEDFTNNINNDTIEEYIKNNFGGNSNIVLELYTSAKKMYEDTQKQLRNAEYSLAKGKKEYEKGLKEYAEGLQEFNDEIEKAEAEIKKAQQDLASLPEARWLILDRNSVQSTYMFDQNCKQMAAIGFSFPFLFFLVAALVCMTTMTRLIDEQRGQIGIFRALGFTKKEIVCKFLVYAFLASIIGSLIGVVVGQLMFPTIIYNTWRLMYYLPPIKLSFPIHFLIICISIFSALMMFVTYLVLNDTLKEDPASLMHPKAPKSARKTFIEKIQLIWERLSFTSKITARNLIRYKSRFFMTVIGVAGCMGLLLVGFGIKDSISEIINIQYDDIFEYNYQINLKNDHHIEENIKVLDENLDNEAVAPFMTYTTKTYFKDDDATATVEVFNIRDASYVLNLRMTDKKTELNLNNAGVIVSEKFAINNNIKKGDLITIESKKGIKAEVKVTDICEMYFQHFIFISDKYYEQVFDEPVHKDCIAVKNADESSILKNVDKLEDYVSLIDFSSFINEFNTMVEALDLIILVIIITAGALAFVVLFNLTQVNISERIKEIATFKVLGFTNHEVNVYIFREILVLSIIGALIGIPLGILEHRFIINVINMDMMMFGVRISLWSFIISFLITIGFTLIVFIFEIKPLREVKMVESLKSVE